MNSPLSAQAVAVLPRVETMVAVLYFGLFAISFDFVSGYTGYLSFGHTMFYGAGAYLVVLTANGKIPFLSASTPFVLLLVLCGLLAVILALLVGVVSFRLSGVYFAMITLGFSQVLYVFVRDWNYLGSNPRDGVAVTGRTAGFEIGIPGVDSASLAIGQLTGDTAELLGVVTLTTAEVSYYMVGLVVLICYFAMQRVIHSPFGRTLIAIRENEERARAIGYNTFYYKLGAFAISAFFAGTAGGLFAGYRRSVTPESGFYFLTTGDALLASIIGGFGTLAGPLYGHLFDESVREFLSKAGSGGGLLPYLRSNLGQGTLETVIYNGMTIGESIDVFLNGRAALYVGIVFVLFVLYVPNGLLGTVRGRLNGTVAKGFPMWFRQRLPDRDSDQSR
ncbi:branched-chain amino acid ABC transporter permease [Halocatena pleomorpha]|uniref:Branched-chain amino acid ABC transporter permease n=2 Tax=Halocatena pleomorpha TaxID=1785090 RepID=A0A3P3RE86_9EURY|nr:branched-chain amino acid ABC transporter permease [Halocatena pleomorpha]